MTGMVCFMSRKIRIIAGVLILLISLSLLIWSLAPPRRETRIQNISPSEMQLPTPSSFYWDDRFDQALPFSVTVHRFAFDPGAVL
jgi:hypothetical protein